MTNEEAIKKLQRHKAEYLDEWVDFSGIVEALDMAIRTLKNEQTDRKFEKIVVDYPPAETCTYPEYRGKPYFSIKFEENGEHVIGFGTYKPEVLSEYIREYFIKSTIIDADKSESGEEE